MHLDVEIGDPVVVDVDLAVEVGSPTSIIRSAGVSFARAMTSPGGETMADCGLPAVSARLTWLTVAPLMTRPMSKSCPLARARLCVLATTLALDCGTALYSKREPPWL
jgi:hypothetical protein